MAPYTNLMELNNPSFQNSIPLTSRLKLTMESNYCMNNPPFFQTNPPNPVSKTNFLKYNNET